MTDRPSYEVVVVGGGPAGLTTALYTTRLGHRTAVLEKEGGRHATVSHVHNLFGVSEDVSGRQLSKLAAEQLEEYGGDYYLDPVDHVRRSDGEGRRSDGEVRRSEDDGDGFVVDAAHSTVEAERVVFATGFSDRPPSVPGLTRFAGRGLHYCLHCDAYTLGDGRAFVLGHDDHAATVAMLLLNFTADVDLLLDGRDPEWGEETDRQIRAHPVERVDEEVVGAFPRDEDAEDPWLGGLTFADGDQSVADGDGEGTSGGRTESRDGTDREYLGGFAMYGKEYNTALAESLGCALADDGALAVDGNFETSVAGVYAVGDVTHGQNQTVVALGDGARAGVALHKDLRRYPRPPDELDDVDGSEVPAAPADIRARMRLVRDRDAHAGLREPAPDR